MACGIEVANLVSGDDMPFIKFCAGKKRYCAICLYLAASLHFRTATGPENLSIVCYSNVIGDKLSGSMPDVYPGTF
jgi:hypothetical protein